MPSDETSWSGGDPDDVTAWTLVRAYHAVGRVFYETLAPYGLSPQQFGVLIEVTRSPGQSQGALARRVLSTPQALGELLRGMEAEGLVARATPEGRGRAIAVRATSKGQALLEQVTPVVLQAVAADRLGLTENRLTALNDELHTIIATLTGGERQRRRSSAPRHPQAVSTEMTTRATKASTPALLTR